MRVWDFQIYVGARENDVLPTSHAHPTHQYPNFPKSLLYIFMFLINYYWGSWSSSRKKKKKPYLHKSDYNTASTWKGRKELLIQSCFVFYTIYVPFICFFVFCLSALVYSHSLSLLLFFSLISLSLSLCLILSGVWASISSVQRWWSDHFWIVGSFEFIHFVPRFDHHLLCLNQPAIASNSSFLFSLSSFCKSI